MQDYRKIKVWGKAHELALATYDATTAFPKEERYGLTSQMRRAAVSIPTNIVEGRARQSDGDFARFLSIALASASELDYLLMLSRDLKYLKELIYVDLAGQTDQVKRMLATFLRKITEDRQMLKAEGR